MALIALPTNFLLSLTREEIDTIKATTPRAHYARKQRVSGAGCREAGKMRKIGSLWKHLYPDWEEGKCPSFGNSVDCSLSTLCPEQGDCAESVRDSEENYCYQCNRVKWDCICSKQKDVTP